MKCSGFFRVSEQPYPYMDARPMIRRLIGAFGSGISLFDATRIWRKWFLFLVMRHTSLGKKGYLFPLTEMGAIGTRGVCECERAGQQGRGRCDCVLIVLISSLLSIYRVSCINNRRNEELSLMLCRALAVGYRFPLDHGAVRVSQKSYQNRRCSLLSPSPCLSLEPQPPGLVPQAALESIDCDLFGCWHRYAKAWQVIDDGDAIEGKPLLTQEERRCIFGHNVMRLFPGGWF